MKTQTYTQSLEENLHWYILPLNFLKRPNLAIKEVVQGNNHHLHDGFSSGYRAILAANQHAQTPGQESNFCELLTTQCSSVWWRIICQYKIPPKCWLMKGKAGLLPRYCRDTRQLDENLKYNAVLIYWILYHWFTFKRESVMLTKKHVFNFYKSVMCPTFRHNFKKLLDFSQLSKKVSFVIDRH